MKTFYSKALKYTAALLLCTATAGCTSFLDEKTYSFVSGDDLYTTAANAELALTGVYDILNAGAIQGTGNQPLWGRGMHYLMMLGDEIAPNGISDPHHQIIASCGYNEEADFVSMAWFGLFVGIDRANHIIQKVPAIDMDPKRRDEIVNEAKLLRGLYRLYQAWLWGEVPLPNTPNSSAEAPREPLDKVYACIEEDLDKAYKELPDRNSNVNGRVNKWTAGGYLLKMYPYLASCKENRVGQELGSPTNSFDWVDAEACWKKAAAIAEDIYAHSGYKLIKPYHYNFLADTKSSQKEECMMVVQTGAGGSNEYFLFAYWAGPQGNVGTNGGGYGWIRPTGELSDKYVTEDSRMGWNLCGSLGNNVTDYTTINGAKYFSPVALYASGANLCHGKFCQSDPAARTSQGIPTWASNIDFPMLRFADIVLLYAEALYKTGDESLARELVEEVRERACTDTDGKLDESALNAMNSAYYKTDFMEELLDERSRELCVEGWRRIDLIRTGKMTEVIGNMKTVNDAGNKYYYFAPQMEPIKNNYKPYKIWMPVPKREREVNKNLSQNPGYTQTI